MRSKHVPIMLVVIAITAAAVIAVIDGNYRGKFFELATAVIVGYWSWMQAPRHEQ